MAQQQPEARAAFRAGAWVMVVLMVVQVPLAFWFAAADGDWRFFWTWVIGIAGGLLVLVPIALRGRLWL